MPDLGHSPSRVWRRTLFRRAQHPLLPSEVTATYSPVPELSFSLDSAIDSCRAHLLSMRLESGHWEGYLSSSALSTATAIIALGLVDALKHAQKLEAGVNWLVKHQNADGGWGDTTISKSNLSTTLLCWSALGSVAVGSLETQEVPVGSVERCEQWIQRRVGSLDPDAICKAVIALYGKDRTFSVPILMTCALCDRLGPHEEAWKRVLTLPFELAAFPRSWFGAIGLPVVSYALPALIAIGHARFYHAPPSWANPLRALRRRLWPRIRPMLKALQPASGGYLEATPLTSFVTMALAGSGQHHHPCVAGAEDFLLRSQRPDGSWPIDTNLATWVTTLSIKGLSAGSESGGVKFPSSQGLPAAEREVLVQWLLDQQYQSVHPFTNAAPGGWAWTNLAGGVPDADDTSGALVALWELGETEEGRARFIPAVTAGMTWLVDLQNRDGGMPTFCRGWGTLPFDRSTSEITAHALWAFDLWEPSVPAALRKRIAKARRRGLAFLRRHQLEEGAWVPLWFGNEHAPGEDNPVHGTAQVVLGLAHCHDPQAAEMLKRGVSYLLKSQQPDGSWGGAPKVAPSLEETANAVSALSAYLAAGKVSGTEAATLRSVIQVGVEWMLQATSSEVFQPAPIGLYFARLWYHERLYPVVWTLGALERARSVGVGMRMGE